jgi:hypothetical protein
MITNETNLMCLIIVIYTYTYCTIILKLLLDRVLIIRLNITTKDEYNRKTVHNSSGVHRMI